MRISNPLSGLQASYSDDIMIRSEKQVQMQDDFAKNAKASDISGKKGQKSCVFSCRRAQFSQLRKNIQIVSVPLQRTYVKLIQLIYNQFGQNLVKIQVLLRFFIP